MPTSQPLCVREGQRLTQLQDSRHLSVSRIPLRRPMAAQSSSVLRPIARIPWAASSSSRSSVSPVTPTAPMTSPAASRICKPPPSDEIAHEDRLLLGAHLHELG